jgi:hypothetical protein
MLRITDVGAAVGCRHQLMIIRRLCVAAALVMLVTVTSSAQTEETEPRVIGGGGVTSVGFSGFIDRFTSSEALFPWHVTAHVDVTRFLTNRIAVRGGLIGSTLFAGDDADERATGPGAASLEAAVAGLFYFTPEAMASLYTGGEYRAPLTSRAERDAGTLLGKAGVQAAMSSRASVFLEGGYGARLTRGDDDELQTRIVAEIGFRIKF